MSPLESTIESYLVKRVQAVGGEIRKLDARVNAHWPDRLVVMPGFLGLVELKRPKGGHLSGGQVELHYRIRAMGHLVWVLWTKEQVDDFMERYEL